MSQEDNRTYTLLEVELAIETVVAKLLQDLEKSGGNNAPQE